MFVLWALHNGYTLIYITSMNRIPIFIFVILASQSESPIGCPVVNSKWKRYQEFAKQMKICRLLVHRQCVSRKWMFYIYLLIQCTVITTMTMTWITLSASQYFLIPATQINVVGFLRTGSEIGYYSLGNNEMSDWFFHSCSGSQSNRFFFVLKQRFEF